MVADLKTRKFYAKCHANRSKTGVEVDFPLSLGPLSMANEQEMQAGERANMVWKQLLAEYEQPPLDPSVVEQIDAYIEVRKAAGGAPLN